MYRKILHKNSRKRRDFLSAERCAGHADNKERAQAKRGGGEGSARISESMQHDPYSRMAVVSIARKHCKINAMSKIGTQEQCAEMLLTSSSLCYNKHSCAIYVQ